MWVSGRAWACKILYFFTPLLFMPTLKMARKKLYPKSILLCEIRSQEKVYLSFCLFFLKTHKNGCGCCSFMVLIQCPKQQWNRAILVETSYLWAISQMVWDSKKCMFLGDVLKHKTILIWKGTLCGNIDIWEIVKELIFKCCNYPWCGSFFFASKIIRDW